MSNTPLDNHYKAWVSFIDEIFASITSPKTEETEETEEEEGE